ncbi:MAG: class I SAM-dependent methyltransferase [Chloroflexaceae bacterium]|nr:class I SAM-dependent methyltransferase [Chloroflexaceae bacterium]
MVRFQHVMQEVTANLAMGIGPVRNWRLRRGRTIRYSPTQHAEEFLKQFQFCIDYIGWDWIQGKTVLEIGPGDVIPHGLMFLGAGAQRYIGADRFLGDVSSDTARQLYAALVTQAPQRVQQGLRGLGRNLSDYPWVGEDGGADSLVLPLRLGMEALKREHIGGVDLIFSYGVVANFSDTGQAFRNMAALLNPGGKMVHRVDYGPIGGFRQYKNPLTMLTVPQPLWQLMGSNRGYNNRYRHSQTLQVLEQAGFQNETKVLYRHPPEFIEAIRPQLVSPFRELDDDDLRISMVDIVSQKV